MAVWTVCVCACVQACMYACGRVRVCDGEGEGVRCGCTERGVAARVAVGREWRRRKRAVEREAGRGWGQTEETFSAAKGSRHSSRFFLLPRSSSSSTTASLAMRAPTGTHFLDLISLCRIHLPCARTLPGARRDSERARGGRGCGRCKAVATAAEACSPPRGYCRRGRG